MSEPIELQGVATYIFMWHSLSDACPKCQALNGREWREQNLFQEVLWDPIWGNLWNLDTDQKLTHPNCRCQLEVRVECDWTKWKPFNELNRALHNGGYGLSSNIAEMRRELEQLKRDLESEKISLTEVNRLFTTYLALARKSGLPPDIIDALSRIQQMRLAIEMLQRSLLMLQVAAGPFGWALALGGLALSTVTMYDLVGSYG